MLWRCLALALRVLALDYLGMHELSKRTMNGSSEQSSYRNTLPFSSALPVFHTTASHGHFSHDELNGDSESKKAYSDRVGDDDSTTPSTSPSHSPSPSPVRSTQRTALDKPLEQLTEEDIMHLTREDCRRFLKEKGMRRPSWNKSQAIQQVLSLKGLFDERVDEEKILRPAICRTKESPLIQDEPSPQYSRLPFNGHNLPPSMPQQSSFAVGYEAGPIPCKVLQRHGSDDMYTTHQPSASHLACSEVSASSSIKPISMNFCASTRPLDSATLTPLQVKASSLPSPDDYSQCAQTINRLLGTEPSAQLTIFYSGMVNVYNNVPADKAQAVMLLAARSNTAKPSLCPLFNIPSTQNVDASSWPTPSYVHSTLATTEFPSTTASPSVSIPVSQGAKSSQSEHQPSRKACLQRYLEKRRGRYNVKTPYPASTKGAECDSLTQLMSDRYKFSNLFEMIGPTMGFPYHANHMQLTAQSSGSETSLSYIPY